MRFTSIALPLFSLVTASVQSHAEAASPAAVSNVSLQRRDLLTNITAIPYLLPGGQDTVRYSDITCSNGAGEECNNNIQTALENAVINYANALRSWVTEDITGTGSAYGFDGYGDVVATLYYYIPAGDSDSDAANSFVNFYDPDTLAENIMSTLSTYNVIEACNTVLVNGYAFAGSTVVVLMGWNDEAYWADPGTLQSWLYECEDVPLPSKHRN